MCAIANRTLKGVGQFARCNFMNKERLLTNFMEMVKIPSESKNERDFAIYLEKELKALGFETKIDDSKEKSGSNTGNLLARLKGTPDKKPVLFTAHMDTVAPGIGIKPIIEGNLIKSDGTTILASDDKAAIAAFLEAVKMLQEGKESHGDIEAAFTTLEECGMHGAKNLDYSFLTAKTAFTLDSGGKPGTVIIQAPAQSKLQVNIKGKAAHAGVEPEKGISAIMVLAEAISHMKLLRIDNETTANIGTISGGTVTNIVAEKCEALFEARSLVVEKLDEQINHMIQCLTDSCNKYGAELKYEVQKSYPPLNVSSDAPAVLIAKKASENIGLTFKATSTGGGSDANIFAGKGFDIVNLAVGMTNPHSVTEYIEIEDLCNTAKFIKEIIKSI